LAFLYSVALTGGLIAVLTVGDVLPFIQLPVFLKEFKFASIGIIAIAYNAVTYSYINIKSGLESAKCSKIEALLGLSPIPIYWVELILVFQTEWAWQNPALALLLTFPSYCLMTCKHIVCSVCKMPFGSFQKSPFLFFLFLVNNIAGKVVPDSTVALFIFIFTLISFLVFVVGCINQITAYLDINCLTIKKRI